MSNASLTPTELTELIDGLHRLAGNLWWTWNQEAQEVFHELSPRGWQNLYHNAVAVLREVSDYELRVRLQDREFAARVRDVLRRFEAYLREPNTWGREHAPKLQANPVAYFSAEFGFHESLPIAAGGLGILAGDHTKAASDLGIGFVGVSLFYREGYFEQTINHENWQTEVYPLLNPKTLALEQVLNAKREPLICSVDIGMTLVYFQAWRVHIGRVPVYLIDSNLPQNEERYRDLTARVYGGDATTRIMQEVLLGIGGVRLLRALGVEPSVFHMNEGHAAFLTLELIREKLNAGKDFTEAAALTKQECIFTTHTPVEAGHDRFSQDLAGYALHRFVLQAKISLTDLICLGQVEAGSETEPFCMTVLALRLSRSANGVSELHGQVSRKMWRHFFQAEKEEDVPIGHITNGIHLLGWMKGTARRFWRSKVGASWEKEFRSPEFWKRLEDRSFVSDEELWALRYKLRRELIEFTRRRLLIQGQRLSAGDFMAFDQLLNPDALTIGFARRFATYKRAPLVFQQLDNIMALVNDQERPVQFVFAGKAHPKDDDGKRFIQHIIHLSEYSTLQGHLVFIENYDVHVARQMASGCDVWLNNPRRPLEASGTSGQKTSCHGCLNLSILDGWWREGYDGSNGFAIGEDSNPDSVEEQDKLDSENLYRVLTEEVIPTFFARDAQGIPRRWIGMMRHAMATLVPKYTTWRMVEEYTHKYYLR